MKEEDRLVPMPPDEDRIVPATEQHPGMTQIRRGGRVFQLGGVGPETLTQLESFAEAAIAAGPKEEA